jgi:hypothetical protein
MSAYTKYPRTFHLPWSESISSDDVWWNDCSKFEGKKVVVTEKLDGECTTMYRDHIHARSMDSGHHASRSWVKQFHGSLKHDIPERWRFCGENLFAFHSILYDELPSYFFLYGIYNPDNKCLSWDETLEICEMLNIQTVPLIYRGLWDEKLIKSLWTGKGRFPTFGTIEEKPKWPESFTPTDAEGYVVRLDEAFEYDSFADSCAKYVRENHVRSPKNWMTKEVVPNRLATI